MSVVIVLDSGPLGLLANAVARSAETIDCHRWASTALAKGTAFVIPEIADYEVRRELLRRGASAGISRLSRLSQLMTYDPLTTSIMRRAAER